MVDGGIQSAINYRDGDPIFKRRPWLALYPESLPHAFQPSCENGVELFERGSRLRPKSDSIYYFDTRIDFETTTSLAHAFAVALRDRYGVRPGDRIAIMLQNVPAAPVALHAVWLIGAVVTPVSVMLKSKELRHQLTDSGAKLMVCLESLYSVVESVRPDTDVQDVITVSEFDFLGEIPEALSGHQRIDCSPAARLMDLLESHAGETVDPHPVTPDDPAILTYTSGTTGPAKGAVNTHRGVAYNAEVFMRWVDLRESDVTVAMAPIFHVTGLVGHIAVSRLAMSSLLLSYRFNAGEMLRLIEKWRGSWMLGPLTAYVAMLDDESFTSRDLSSLTKVCSGGAPVRPAVVKRFEDATGAYVHNMYGMTESTGPSICVPLGTRAPVDPDTGALAIGVPVFGVDCRIVDPDTGEDVGPGELGEIVTRGPAVVPGYWRNEAETKKTIRDGWLYSGDIGKRDAEGWIYLVDRLKDQINVSGYKVWPRDVEDVLLQHPAVKDGAVVGAPDSYRGERVVAFVVPEPGRKLDAEDIIRHCREQLAVYKAPREIREIDSIPRNAAGKVLRRTLRDMVAAG